MSAKKNVVSRTSPESNLCGLPAYCGYEYQFLATAWIALELTTTNKAEAVVVEPPSQEDITAQLIVPPEQATSQVEICNNLQIQIKLRNNLVWTTKTFKNLIETQPSTGARGPAPRPRALEYLKQDESCHYLLMTNAGVDRNLQSFVVNAMGEQSRATNTPGETKADPNVANRIGILPEVTCELLKLRIAEILTARCHVPGPNVETCIDELKNRVRDRLLHIRANRFPAHELREIVCLHGGSFTPPYEPVHPSNFGRIRTQLSSRYALVLVGPPGTGKTTLSNSLMAEYEKGNPPALRISVTDASMIDTVRRSIDEAHDHIYYFEDPWGQDVPGPESTHFTTELPRLMRRARNGKRFVVTSRLGVFQQSVGTRIDLFAPYKQELHPKDYDSSDYRELYKRQIDNWQPNHRHTALGCRDEALKLLETPYSVEIFCQTLLPLLEATKNVSSLTVQALAQKSNVNSFGAVLKDRIIAGGDECIKAAIAIWALIIVTNNSIEGADIQQIRSLLVSGGMQATPDVQRLFNDLADAKWFQSRSNGYTTTPSVREALSQFEQDNPALFQATFSALFSAWASANQFDRVLLCVKASKGGISNVPNNLELGLDEYLVQVTKRTDGYHFIYALKEIVKYSSPQHPVAVLARLLTRVEPSPPRKGWFIEMNPPKWMKPSLAASEIDQLKIDSAWFVEKFVTEYLLHETRSFQGTVYAAQELIDFLNQFGWPIREWFNTAFENSLRWSEESAGFLTDCICLIDALSLDRIFDICLKTYQEVCDRPHSYDHEEYRKGEQGETDAPRCDDYDDSESYIAKSALRSALLQKIKRDGYTWISSHPAVKYLLKPWSDLLYGKTDNTELSTFITCCVQNGAIGDIYDVLRCGADTTLVPIVVGLILKQTDLSYEANKVAENYANLPDFLTTIETEAKKVPIEQRTLVGLRLMSGSCAVDTVLERLLPDDELRIIRACYSVKIPQSIETISDQTDEGKLIQLVNSWPDNAAIYALEVLKRMGSDITPWITRFTSLTDCETRARAWKLCEDKGRLSSQGLMDEDCWCRVASLENLAERATHEEQLHLMALTTDKSAYVRKALAECIGNKQWADGVSPLISLLKDCREYGSQEHECDFQIFEVARSACNSLNKYPQLPETALDSIRSFLGKCTKASVDTTVHGLLFKILSKYPSDKTMRFCSLYIKGIWLRSKWRENDGRDLLVQCLHSIIEMLLSTPALASHLDVTKIAKFAAWDAEDDDLIGAALALIGVTAEHNEPCIDHLAQQLSFTPDRARLLLAASDFLQKKRPVLITQHLASEEPFMKLLDWAATMNRQPPYAEFCTANPSVAAWVDTLKDKKAGVPAYERWAISRLIDPTATPETTCDLPHPFSFREC